MAKFVLQRGLRTDDVPLQDRRGDPAGKLLMGVLTIRDTQSAINELVNALGAPYKFAGGEKIGYYGLMSARNLGECVRARVARLDEMKLGPPQPVKIEVFEPFNENKGTPPDWSKQAKRLETVLRLDLLIAMGKDVIDSCSRKLEAELLKRKTAPFLGYCEVCGEKIPRELYVRHQDPWRNRCARH
jgi:hypothetical protein